MAFIEEHQAWLNHHLARRKGERRDRLKRGHGHGEQLFLKNVWWPLFGNFDGLHPEFEVTDWRGMRFFIDLLWQAGAINIGIEIKGYGPHVEQTDRTRFRRELNRELFLQGLGYRIVSIAYGELEDNPELIKSFMKAIISPYLNEKKYSELQYTYVENEVMRLALRLGRVIRPMDVVKQLGVSQKTAIKYLKLLSDKGKLLPIRIGKSQRIMKYEFTGSFLDIGLR